ncbi:transposase-like protein [Paenibacillus sp. RC254]|uniref:hypothetical protein n=1 Tax=unclassified Paenibacillus TaxID=185978 RepID=UPI0024BBDB3F|nr:MULTISPECIES: hypothetical protein [unclassified Paenibacillus]
MKKKQYDLNFKKMMVAKGKEIGNMTAIARQHELDPKMVLRWAREFNLEFPLWTKHIHPLA